MDTLEAVYASQRFVAHFHPTYTFGVIVRGECHFERELVSYVARAGEVFVIHPYQLHTGGSGQQGLEYRAVFPRTEWLRALLPPRADGALPCFDAAVYRDQRADALITGEGVERFLLDFIARHATGWSTFAGPSQARSPIGRACEILERHWQRMPTSQALADGLGLSRWHFIRLFRREVGMTPSAYARHLRLDHAKRLIEAGESLAAAALEARFADQSHLTREFKRVYGVSPGAVDTR